MKIKLNETIRELRRERKMTQEQLAQALGVTTGAVSKWESGLSNPDLSLLPELAALFDTSVDALLGYEWQEQSEKQAAEKIRRLNLEKRFRESEKIIPAMLQKFPNSFRVVFECGRCLGNMALEEENDRQAGEAAALLERACGLIGQNRDESVSRESIQSEIALLYFMQERKEEAVAILRKNNVSQVYSARIASFLVGMDRFGEAAEHASDSLVNAMRDLFMDVTSLIPYLQQKGERQEALALSAWMQQLLLGLCRDDGSYPRRLYAVLLTLDALILAGERPRNGDAIRGKLRAARAAFAQFARNPQFSNASVRFYRGKEHSFYDDVGGSDSVKRILGRDDDPEERDCLLKIWREVCEDEDAPG